MLLVGLKAKNVFLKKNMQYNQLITSLQYIRYLGF